MSESQTLEALKIFGNMPGEAAIFADDSFFIESCDNDELHWQGWRVVEKSRVKVTRLQDCKITILLVRAFKNAAFVLQSCNPVIL